MPSAAISGIAYEAETRTLSVWFRESGELYRYFDVPQRIHEAFIKAGPNGRFFNHYIKDNYPFQHTKSPDGGRHAA
jgi:KTSC domain